MNWRKLLAPFAGIWWMTTQLRNLFYDHKIFPSNKFEMTIVIGNLSLGGTGKSPHAIYVLDLLYRNFNVAVLSRGYGRETSGFIVANYDSNAQQIGDEPMQFFNRFKNRIIVSVGEDRVAALKKLFKQYHLDVVILDDAFQHRKLNAGYNILLTSYHDLYSQDYVLPVGNLRESKINANRAQSIIVTKCPSTITDEEKESIKRELKIKQHQNLFFSQIIYHSHVKGGIEDIQVDELINHKALVITGIANATPFIQFCSAHLAEINHLSFPDHYNFKPEDVEQLKEVFDQMQEPKIMLTTEKDYMRLKQEYALIQNLYYLPISIEIDKEKEFNQIIIDYVTKNKRSNQLSSN